MKYGNDLLAPLVEETPLLPRESREVPHAAFQSFARDVDFRVAPLSNEEYAPA